MAALKPPYFKVQTGLNGYIFVKINQNLILPVGGPNGRIKLAQCLGIHIVFLGDRFQFNLWNLELNLINLIGYFDTFGIYGAAPKPITGNR